MYSFRSVFNCEFDPIIYPFDFQLCELTITLSERQLATVRWVHSLSFIFSIQILYQIILCRPVLGNLTYNGPETVNKFLVKNVKFCNAIIDSSPYVVIQFTFTRNLMGSLLNDFLPFLICIVIGHTTIYYENFEISAGTNLTLLLVLVTL